MERLLAVIPSGKENAMHQRELAKLLGVNPATVKSMVREARLKGLQILSGTCGYWIAENDLEKKQFVALMRKQAISRLSSVKLINRTIEEIDGQICLSEAQLTATLEGVQGEQKKEK